MIIKPLARLLQLLPLLAISLTATAHATPANGHKAVRIGYLPHLETSVLETRLVGQIIHQEFKVPVRYEAVTPDQMWRELANGKLDVSVSAWLQSVDSPEYHRWWTKITNLGTNVQHTRVGLVVPASADAHSIRDLRDQAALYQHQILVVHDGTGAATEAQQAIKRYGLRDFGTVAITSRQLRKRLNEARHHHLNVVAAIWGPSRLESEKGLRWLDDSKGIFETNGDIVTIVSNELVHSHADVYHFLHRYYLGRPALKQMMQQVKKGEKPARVAADWREAHAKIVAGWLMP